MANIKISELSPLITVQDADVLPIVDNAVTKKVTAAILRSYTEGNSVLLTGAQTVAGIKTFTAQLASSVATGTAPFSVASTTKVTNLNADLLDGLSSADFALSTRTLTAGTGLTGGGDLTANRTFAIDSTVATLTGTQTLTNKTITSPVINEILDSNGNEILGFTPIASATDYITIKNGIGVGVPLHISAAGSSTNTGLHLEPKGTGLVQISDGTDTTKGIRFRSSGSAASAITLIDAVSSAGHVITLPNATTTLVGTNTTDTITNKSISGATNTLSNIGNASLTNSAITINGTSTSLGGSINVGTVTSVAALTLGTSGTDLTSSVATGTTTPVITLNVPTASASNRGALSSTDWSTFNAKQNAITLTTTGTSGAATLVGSTLNIPNYADTDTGITSLNGLTALTQTFAVGTSGTDFDISSATSTHTFNLPTASAANRGALSSADWTTFNNKASTAALANYLPLAGGTLTGALNGTSAVFSSTITSTNGGLLLQNSAANSSVVGLITEGTWPWRKLIDTETSQNSYGEYIDGSVFYAKRIDFADRNSAISGVGTNIYTLNLATGVSTFSGNVNINNAPNDADIAMTIQASAGSNKFLLFGRDSSSSAVCNISSAGAATFSSVTVSSGGSTNGRLGVRGTTNDSSAYAFEAANASGATLFIVRNDGASIFSAGLSLNSATAPASGIEFPATQVASASANNLDDYEEGTWTMGISFNNGTTGITYSSTTGNYVKIGKQVTVTGYVEMTSKGSSTGIARITGLPFTIGSANANYSAPSFWTDGITFTVSLQGYGNVSATTIDLLQISALGVGTVLTETNFANNSRFMVTLTYFV